MCLACGVSQIPVCSLTGACGGVSLLTQIIILASLSFTIALGTIQLWYHLARARFCRLYRRAFNK
jgi:hypothetical protein